MASLNAFRAAIRDKLSASLAIDFLDGFTEGPSSDRDVGVTWPISKAEDTDHVTEEDLTVGIRVFKRYDRSEAPEILVDPEPFETIAETIQSSLDDIETTAGPWFFRVTSVEFDFSRYMVEATVVGRQANTFATGA